MESEYFFKCILIFAILRNNFRGGFLKVFFLNNFLFTKIPTLCAAPQRELVRRENAAEVTHNSYLPRWFCVSLL